MWATYKHMTKGRRTNYRLRTEYRHFLKHLDHNVDQDLVKRIMEVAYYL